MRKAINPIHELLKASVLTKSTHPGFMVYTDRGNGWEDIGPYPTAEIALDCASDFAAADVVDLETGEVISHTERTS